MSKARRRASNGALVMLCKVKLVPGDNLDSVACDKEDRLLGPFARDCDDIWYTRFMAKFDLSDLDGQNGNGPVHQTCWWDGDKNCGYITIEEFGTPGVENGCNPAGDNEKCGAAQMKNKINERLCGATVSTKDWWGPNHGFRRIRLCGRY